MPTANPLNSKAITSMYLSCCIWALTATEEENLQRMVDLDFAWIDIQPQMLATPELRAAVTELGLGVSSVGASFGLPAGAALDSEDAAARSAALAHVAQSCTHAASLGARAAYVIPGMDTSPAALARFADSMDAAAEHAQSCGVRLCIEHFPGRALDTAAATLRFVESIGHPNFYLLYDSGHIQMRKEDPAAVIERAGNRLGYVHLDDNDGVGDLHWSLLDGVMTEATLERTFSALRAVGYSGPVSLELSPQLPDPVNALAASARIVRPYLS